MFNCLVPLVLAPLMFYLGGFSLSSVSLGSLSKTTGPAAVGVPAIYKFITANSGHANAPITYTITFPDLSDTPIILSSSTDATGDTILSVETLARHTVAVNIQHAATKSNPQRRSTPLGSNPTSSFILPAIGRILTPIAEFAITLLLIISCFLIGSDSCPVDDTNPPKEVELPTVTAELPDREAASDQPIMDLVLYVPNRYEVSRDLDTGIAETASVLKLEDERTRALFRSICASPLAIPMGNELAVTLFKTIDLKEAEDRPSSAVNEDDEDKFPNESSRTLATSIWAPPTTPVEHGTQAEVAEPEESGIVQVECAINDEDDEVVFNESERSLATSIWSDPVVTPTNETDNTEFIPAEVIEEIKAPAVESTVPEEVRIDLDDKSTRTLASSMWSSPDPVPIEEKSRALVVVAKPKKAKAVSASSDVTTESDNISQLSVSTKHGLLYSPTVEYVAPIVKINKRAQNLKPDIPAPKPKPTEVITELDLEKENNRSLSESIWASAPTSTTGSQGQKGQGPPSKVLYKAKAPRRRGHPRL